MTAAATQAYTEEMVEAGGIEKPDEFVKAVQPFLRA